MLNMALLSNPFNWAKVGIMALTFTLAMMVVANLASTVNPIQKDL